MPLSRISSLGTSACLAAWEDAKQREFEISVAEGLARRVRSRRLKVLETRAEFVAIERIQVAGCGWLNQSSIVLVAEFVVLDCCWRCAVDLAVGCSAAESVESCLMACVSGYLMNLFVVAA